MNFVSPSVFPHLPGYTVMDAVIAEEKINNLHTIASEHCFNKCVKFYGVDSLPYHPGEKTCWKRCISHLRNYMEMAEALKNSVP